MALQPVESPPWSDLLPELLGRIAACCPKPVDRGSFRAVCRSWHFAVRHHCPRTPLTPWVLLPDGSFLTLSDGHRDLPSAVHRYGLYVKPSGGGRHHLQLPKNTTCIGYSNGWLALLHKHPESLSEHGVFLLHDPFSNKTVPLPEVDAISAKAPWPHAFDVFKVLMRSTADDIVSIMTFSRHYPFVLCLPGKSAWTPESETHPFMHIVDIAFLGDKLYGITKAEDLFSFDLALHDHVPVIDSCKRVVRHPVPLDPYSYDDYPQWSDVDEDDDRGNNEEPLLSGDEGDGDDEEELLDLDDYYEYDSENEAYIWNQAPIKIDCWFDEDDKERPEDEIATIRYLVESHGKLIMVRRHLRIPNDLPRYTRKVEVFEADIEVGAWVSVAGRGLSDHGSALFISQRFSKSVFASEYGDGQVDEGAIYFMDTGEVFHVRSTTISPALWCLGFGENMWVFPPDLT
ncbi:hypothetical protein QOZ80_5AG0365340 [Eleusine coracana subsp. coracana]|nr:hypothetical protein QOZ80_5AG0365340 [Eleusine coracana subsp. coracana]